MPTDFRGVEAGFLSRPPSPRWKTAKRKVNVFDRNSLGDDAGIRVQRLVLRYVTCTSGRFCLILHSLRMNHGSLMIFLIWFRSYA